MVDNGVLKPTFYEGIRSTWHEDEEAKKTGVAKEDNALATLAATSGWKILKEYVDSLKKTLDLKLQQAVSSGMTEAEIGKSAVMSVLAKDMLDSIVSKVEDSALIVEEIQNERRQAEKSGKAGN